MRYCVLAAVLLAGCAAQPPPPAPRPMVKAEPPKIVIPPDPLDGLAPNVRAAIEGNTTPVLHHGITTFYAYSPDVQYTVYCQPLRATELRLSPDEYVDKDSVILGDSVRWGVRVGVHTVMVEPLATPADPNMTSNLVIATDHGRSYHLMLRLRPKFMAAVAWYYPSDVKAAEAARQIALTQAAAQASDPPAKEAQ